MRPRRRAESRLPEGDDGRTIANMNAEGMPWYAPRRPSPGKAAQRDAATRDEDRAFMWGALKAALLIAAVMSAGLVLFVALCLWIWCGR